ncbi:MULTISPECIES: tetratricopeptide repeat protein [Saccharothrix]|uniref:tetratricopeptide repeat protein n=1 Tax=Saccharothrix TaxID=2071 RepID=UPI00093BF8BE|nr:tetratricopeptide repeat protein [Saccharothrix sp. CB00851]OKI25017.1 hypothetical protein A6A25_34095 [Saccharothrix sp. CB00851]
MSDSGFALRRRDLVLPERTVSLTEFTPRTGQAPPFEVFRLMVELLTGRDGMVLLSGPVDWRELRERAPGVDRARWSEPVHLAHSLGPRFACVRLDDLFRAEHEDFVTVDEHGTVVPPDRRARRLPAQRPLFLRFPKTFPLVIGSPEAIQAVTAASPAKLYQARDARIDYAEFHHLWHGPAPDAYFSVENLSRSQAEWDDLLLACGIGKTFGRSHAKAVLNGDARDFVGTMLDDAARLDDEHTILLIPRPTDAHCAADIATRLPAMDRPRWLAFRAGYLSRRPDGQGVIDLLEHGDTTGWAHSARNDDWFLARIQAEAQLAADGPADRRLAEASDLISRKALTDPPTIRDDELALSFARALALTGRNAEAEALCHRVVAERAARLGADHPETRHAATALAPHRKRRWWRT